MHGQDLSAPFPGYDHNRHLATALILLSLVVIGGTLGFVWIEDWQVWRALYFTLVTITTVGYGDEGMSETGKKFATLLLVGGIGIASYTFALIVQTAVTSQLAWRRRMQKRINKLSGHTIVCGFGRMGKSVCRELDKEEIEFVVVEKSDEAFHAACQRGYMAVFGSASDDETLLRAGVRWASHVVSVVDSEAESIVIALSSRELHPGISIITRADSDEGQRKLLLAGADKIVSPYQSGGHEISTTIARPRVADFLARTTLDGGDLGLADMTIDEASPLVGKTLEAYGKRAGTKICFVALQRPGQKVMIPPRGGTRLEADDHLIVAGDPEQIAVMRERALGRRVERAA